MLIVPVVLFDNFKPLHIQIGFIRVVIVRSCVGRFGMDIGVGRITFEGRIIEDFMFNTLFEFQRAQLNKMEQLNLLWREIQGLLLSDLLVLPYHAFFFGVL